MKSKFLACLAACLALAMVPASAVAQKGPAATGEQISIRVCNNTNSNATVAVSYQPLGQNTFYNEGWFNVGSRSCTDLVTTGNAYFYGYAEVIGDANSVWAGDFPLCVQYPGPYAFWTYGTQCEVGQVVRNFVSMHADNWGVYTWTLTP